MEEREREIARAEGAVAGLREVGLPEYRRAVRRFNEWAEGRPVNEELVREFFRRLREENYSASYQRTAKTAIKKAIYATLPGASDVGFRTRLNAFLKEIRVPTTDVSLGASRSLSREELREILGLLRPPYNYLIEALYYTGARISELLSVRLCNCRRIKNYVEMEIIGKRAKQGVLIMPAELYDRIRERLGGGVYLFENPATGRPFTRQTAGYQLRRAAEKLESRAYPHLLRHSRITHLLREGKPLDAVCRFARHSDPSFTARVYGHNRLDPDEIVNSGLGD